jgi:hypothetical protein
MEFSILNIRTDVEAKPDGFCVVGHLEGCNDNNIVNNSKWEAPSNNDVDDLVMQKVLLENLRKQMKL